MDISWEILSLFKDYYHIIADDTSTVQLFIPGLFSTACPLAAGAQMRYNISELCGKEF